VILDRVEEYGPYGPVTCAPDGKSREAMVVDSPSEDMMAAGIHLGTLLELLINII